jgi:hypothetical protein
MPYLAQEQPFISLSSLPVGNQLVIKILTESRSILWTVHNFMEDHNPNFMEEHNFMLVHNFMLERRYRERRTGGAGGGKHPLTEDAHVFHSPQNRPINM